MKIFYLIIYFLFLSSDFKVLFFGHAYGTGDEINQAKIDFQNYISNYNDNHDIFIFGGDFIKDCSSKDELDNFKKSISQIIDSSVFIYGNHEFYCYGEEQVGFLKQYENNFIVLDENILFFINSNFKSESDVDEVLKIIKQNNDYSRVIIFTHQTFYENTDLLLRTNSREFYDLGYSFFNKLLKMNLNNLFIISGDIGSTKYLHDIIYYKKDHVNLLATGLGNPKNSYGIEINLDSENIKIRKIKFPFGLKTDLVEMNRYSIYLENLLLFLIQKSSSKKAIVLYFLIFIVIIYLKSSRTQSI